jgi:hypothetical protein
MNAGLDNSKVSGLYIEAETLKRRTWPTLTERYCPGIAIVQA